MSSILNRKSNINELKKDILSAIKYFHIFFTGVLFVVTEEDQVYVRPKKAHPYAINKTSEDVIEERFTLFTELCNQNICEFFEGNQCFYAKTVNNEIISWGSNEQAQLGRTTQTFKSTGKIDFNSKYIFDMKCGDQRYLALTSDGLVYYWGVNTLEWISNENDQDLIAFPVKLGENYGIKHKIKQIHCVDKHCFALTISGKVYQWGDSYCKSVVEIICQLPLPIRLLPVKSVSKISNSAKYLILLDKKGSMSSLDLEKLSVNPVQIYKDKKWSDIEWSGSHLLLKGGDNENVYQESEFSPNLLKTNWNNFYEYLLYGKTLKTIRISSEGFLMHKIIEIKGTDLNLDDCLFPSNINSTIPGIFVEKYKILNEMKDKYKNNFKAESVIGVGSFGKVIKVNDFHGNLFAMKQVWINKENQADTLFDEYRLLSKLDNYYVTEVFSTWIEDRQFIYIQMELCLGTFKKLIELKTQLFNRQSGQPMKLSEFYISFELFIELTECINYLHSLKHPIIHRDLKPGNVLYTNGMNGRLLKLCDFGLAKVHQKSSHTQGVGTDKYKAPEVINGRKYNQKADVYSLGIIGKELFDFDRNESGEIFHRYESNDLSNNFNGLQSLINKMTNAIYEQRIDTKTVLNEMKNIPIDEKMVKHELLLSMSDDERNMVKNSVFYEYIYSKLNLGQLSMFLNKK